MYSSSVRPSCESAEWALARPAVTYCSKSVVLLCSAGDAGVIAVDLQAGMCVASLLNGRGVLTCEYGGGRFVFVEGHGVAVYALWAGRARVLKRFSTDYTFRDVLFARSHSGSLYVTDRAFGLTKWDLASASTAWRNRIFDDVGSDKVALCEGVVACSGVACVQVLEASNGGLVRELSGPSGRVMDLEFGDEGDLYCLSNSGCLGRYSPGAHSPESVRLLDVPQFMWIACVAPKLGVSIVQGVGGRVFVCSVATGKLLATSASSLPLARSVAVCFASRNVVECCLYCPGVLIWMAFGFECGVLEVRRRIALPDGF